MSTMQTLQISVAALKAVSLAAAKKDIRCYLNGVLVERVKNSLFIVGTDGSRLHAYNLGENFGEDFQVIIPAESIKKALTGEKRDSVVLSLSAENNSLNGLQFNPLDGRFPDWRRVIPRKVETTDLSDNFKIKNLNSEFLSDLGKASKLLGNKFGGITLHCMGFSWLVKIPTDSNFVAVIMPLRTNKDDECLNNSAPEWIN